MYLLLLVVVVLLLLLLLHTYFYIRYKLLISAFQGVISEGNVENRNSENGIDDGN